MTGPVTRVNKGKRMIHVDSRASGRTVKSSITVSRDLEKYFRHLTFYSRFDEDVDANESILNIPALSILLPLAWITGSDVYVDELDRTFAESMSDLQQEYKKMYPRAPFRTRLITENLVDNKTTKGGTALLFSGGLDSTYSLFSNIDLNPRLVMIFGVWDLPLSNVELQDRIKRVYLDFADREGFILNFIRTNALEMLDIDRVEHFFWRFDHGQAKGFWMGLGYSLGQIGQVAPLSICRFNRILFAGSRDVRLKIFLNASYLHTDEKIKWANLDVKHDGGIDRPLKVQAIKKYLTPNRVKLRVCGVNRRFQTNSFNCNRCEKCLRTISNLALFGVDPNECGFDADNSSFNQLRSRFEKGRIEQKHIVYWCRPLQKLIPDEITQDYYGSKEFFEWYKTLNFETFNKSLKITDELLQLSKKVLAILYFKTPYIISNTARRFLENRNAEPFKR
jgi:hypothetical protein